MRLNRLDEMIRINGFKPGETVDFRELAIMSGRALGKRSRLYWNVCMELIEERLNGGIDLGIPSIISEGFRVKTGVRILDNPPIIEKLMKEAEWMVYEICY